MEETKKHALLSPSAANRWLHCTPSAVAESAVADEGSVYALEGSLAHAVCAFTILERLGRDTAPVRREIDELTRQYGCYPSEIDEHAAEYADIVLGVYEEECSEGRAEIHIETPLDLSDWAPESFGTADAVIIGPERLTVIDFKYGRGVQVDARGNAQMRMYAFGALDEFGIERNIGEVRMMIIQPRINNSSVDFMTRGELIEWGESYLRPLANVAARGLGVRDAGSWCKFCKVSDTCHAIDRQAALAFVTEPERQTPEQLGKICLPMIEPLELWIDSVKSKALAALLQGNAVPGYKMVRKRGSRKFTDEAAAIEKLRNAGYEDDAILRSPALRTLGDLEKLVGKKQLPELMGDLLIKSEGDITIAEESDRRKAVTSANAFEGIKID